MNPTVTVARKNNSAKVLAAVATMARKQVYVGIPENSPEKRAQGLLEMAGKKRGRKAKAKLIQAAAEATIGNAELLYIQSKGSPARHIPPRPVIEPAIAAKGNKEAIGAELGAAAKATLNGNEAGATQRMKRAGMAAQRAAQGWFTDPRNNWAPNAPSTIAAKGSDRPLIDEGAMRQAITYIVKEN